MSAASGGGARHGGDDDSLVETGYPPGSYPASRRKQVLLGTACALLAVSLFLPWWRTEVALSKLGDSFNAWSLLLMGVGWSSYGNLSPYSAVGNVLFGLVPVAPALVLIVLLLLRVTGVAVLPAVTLFLYSLFAALGVGWTFVFGVLRLDAANGRFPVLAGPWIVLFVCLALCTMLLLWWRSERAHFPPRRWLGLGPLAPVEHPEPVDTAELFRDIPLGDAEDEPIDLDDPVDGTTGEGRPG